MSSGRYRAAEPAPSRATRPAAAPSTNRHNTTAVQREQELCLDALESGDYDAMSDKQWVELCERIAREEKEAHAASESEEA